MSASFLKILACFFMLIDHIGFCFFPRLLILRIIGRLAFPIFAYQIATGFKLTSNRKKYFFRIALFALISQIPYAIFRDVSGYSSFSLNIGFTFVIAFVALLLAELAKKKNFLYIFLITPLLPLATVLNVDYKWYGVLLIVLFYLFDIKNIKEFPLLLFAVTALSFAYVTLSSSSSLQYYAMLSLIILAFANGKKGFNLKYLFYVFYPLHMLILSLIKFLI